MPKPEDEVLRTLWSERARVYGKRCVLDLAIPESEYDSMTDFQWAIFEPILKSRLNGKEKRVLDYGCGPGRFTPKLSQLCPNATVLGFDPCAELIQMAPAGASYISTDPDDFFGTDKLHFDLIFIALVLGGIPDSTLPTLAMQLTTALSNDGLLLFAEHTHPTERGNSFWHTRSELEYKRLFAPLSPTIVATYVTRGSGVAVFVGRKERW